MTTLILQTAALLLCAYFLGAWLACIIRRTFSHDADEAYVPAAVARASVPGGAVEVAPPTRRPDPKPIAIETIERSAPHAAQDAASRFEAALTKVPAPAAGAAKPVTPIPAAPTPAAPPVTRPAPVAAAPVPAATASTPVAPAAPTPVAKAPAAPPAPAPAAPAVTPAAVAAAVAAPVVAAATAAVAKAAPAPQPAQPAAPVPPPPAAAAAPRTIMPAASSGAGPSAVSAPIAPAPAPVAPPAAEDFTRIRDIDPALHQRLVKLGVTRYRDMASWTPGDVARFSKEFGFTGRIEQENWIEQAQILARGGLTAYARRRDAGLVATAQPTASEGQAKPIAAAPAAAAPPLVAATPPQPTAAAAATATATAAALAAAAVRPAVTPPAPAATAPAQPSVPPQVESRAAFANQPRPAAPAAVQQPPVVVTPAPAPLKPVAASPVAATPAPATPAPATVAAKPAAAAVATPSAQGAAAPVASGLGRDNLQRISGINAEVERLLNVQGFSRYNQVANWSPDDAARIDRLLGHQGRVARESWIEQAALLARGGDTVFSRQYDQRLAAKPAAASVPPTPTPTAVAGEPRPSRLAEAIAAKTGPDAAAAAAAAAAGAAVAAVKPAPAVAPAPSAMPAAATAQARGADMSQFRSVRSEHYAPPGRPGTGDDLKRIRGVGALIEKKLNSMGVTSYAQVANWSAADIDRISQVLDFKGRIERENWVEQARILSAGGQTEFSRRVDRGEVETSRNS